MKYLITSLLLFFLITTKAQDISVGNQGAVLYSCSSNGSLFDPGGAAGSYTAGQSFVLTICPNPALPAGVPVAFEFVSANFGHPNDFLAFYDGANTVNAVDFIYSFSQTSSQAVGSRYRATLANVTGCITVQFFSDGSSSGGNFEFNILCLPPCKTVTANFPSTSIPVQATEPNYIHSCTDNPINFTGTATYDANPNGYTQSNATSTFYWDFGSAGYDTGQVVSMAFEPGIYPVKLIVEDVAGCQSLNEINLSIRQTLVPNVQFFASDSIACLGETIDVSPYLITTSGDILIVGDTALYDTLKVQTSVSIQDTAFLPDDSDGISGNGITTPAVYEFPIFGYQAGATLIDVNDLLSICLDIEHSFVGDLDIVLECPNGQTVDLINFTPPGTPGWFLGEPDDFNFGVPGIPYTYCWSPAANPADSIAENNFAISLTPNNAVDPTVLYNAPGNDWSNLLGCPLNGNWIIQVFDDYGSDDGFVFGASIEFDGSFALNPDTFLVAYDNPVWNANPQITSSLTNDSISVQTITNPFQTLTFTFNDNLGCSWETDFDAIEISTVSVVNVFADTTICAPDTLSITANVAGSGSTCTYTLQMFDDFGDGWNGGFLEVLIDGASIGTFDIDFIEAIESFETFSVSNGQTIDIVYFDLDAFPNEVSYSLLDADGNIIFSDGPNPTAGNVFTTTANCLGGFTYEWFPSAEILSTDANMATIYPTQSMVYTVIVTNEFGCKDTTTSNLIYDDTNTPVLDLSTLPVQFCCTETNLNVDLTNYITGPALQNISINGNVTANDSLNLSSSNFTNSDTLNYTITALAQNGCQVSEQVAFFRNCINPYFESVDTIYVGASDTFTVYHNTYDNISYMWTTTDLSANAITNPTQQSAIFNGVFENSYLANVSVTAAFNQNNGTVLECVEIAETQAYEVVDILDLRFPDAFSPNGDAINNEFKPIMSEYGKIIDFRVYNRWGDKVYDISTSDNKNGWDGTLNGKEQPADLYIYYITIQNFNEIISKESHVTLIR